MQSESIFTQIIPRSKPDLADFREDARALRARLVKQGNDPTWYCQSFHPYPLAISSEHFCTQKKLQTVLCKALKTIVENYFQYTDLQEWLSLPEPVQNSLSKLADRPFRLGSYRPDFLHTFENSIAVCEINARFPANAYFISYYLNNIVEETQELWAFPGIKRTVDIFADFFASSNTIAALYRREKGWDRHFFEYEMQLKGKQVISQAADSSQAAGAVLNEPARDSGRGLFLELHQDELVETNMLDFICSNFDKLNCLNDPRTIFLVHDKRMLSILSDKVKLSTFVDSAEADFLSSHIVPTWTLKDNPEKVSEALLNMEQFVLKPNLLGKGEGLLFGATTDADVLREALTNEQNCNYVLQSFIPQKKTPIYMEIEGSLELSPLNIVGTLLCFDDLLLGPGIYRASRSDIVNVAGGGAILVPMLSRS